MPLRVTHGADYAASKAGILGFMRSLALELADRKINVNAVAPGTIDTDIIASYTPEQREKRAMVEVPLKRIGMPEDVANACLFLASGLSDYITGETIHVNGGLYIR
ncbi:MAG: SDR family oxidoreductase [Thermoplasmata archaeon]|nr:MAG: SDR family oxidoreductase [Thermoplasmata archaeon]